MLRQNEAGVLSGSEVFFNSVDINTRPLFYYTPCCGHYHCDQNYCIDRSHIDGLLLIFVEGGTMKLSYRAKDYTALGGDILLFDGAYPHRYTADPYAEFYWFHLDGSNSLDLYSYLMRSRGSVLYRTPNNGKAAAHIRTLLRQFSTNQIISVPEQSRLIYNVLCYLMPGSHSDSSPLSEASPVQQATKYIQANPGGDLSLKRLAAEVHLSPSHLIRLFRAELNYSPHEYVVLMRLERAQYLLKTTDLPVKAIALEVGYGNESSFTGAFTEKIGISPRKFRELPLG